jgi:hypothetical protein
MASDFLEYHQLVKLCASQSEEVIRLTEQLKKAEEVIRYYQHDGGRDEEDVELVVKQFSGHLLDVQQGGKKAREYFKNKESKND